MMAKHSKDVVPADLPRIARGELVVLDVAHPHGSESNDPTKTGGGYPIPPGLKAGAHRFIAGNPVEVLSVGEGTALVRFEYDHRQDWVPWRALTTEA